MTTGDDLVSMGLMALAMALLIVFGAIQLDKELSRRERARTDAKRHKDN